MDGRLHPDLEADAERGRSVGDHPRVVGAREDHQRLARCDVLSGFGGQLEHPAAIGSGEGHGALLALDEIVVDLGGVDSGALGGRPGLQHSCFRLGDQRLGCIQLGDRRRSLLNECRDRIPPRLLIAKHPLTEKQLLAHRLMLPPRSRRHLPLDGVARRGRIELEAVEDDDRLPRSDRFAGDDAELADAARPRCADLVLLESHGAVRGEREPGSHNAGEEQQDRRQHRKQDQVPGDLVSLALRLVVEDLHSVQLVGRALLGSEPHLHGHSPAASRARPGASRQASSSSRVRPEKLAAASWASMRSMRRRRSDSV